MLRSGTEALYSFMLKHASMHCLVLFEVEGLPINRIVDHFYNRECIDSS